MTAPRWLDVSCDAPANVVHAGPLATAVRSRPPAIPDAKRPCVLLTFSTTIMEGQAELIDRVCEAAAGLGLDAVLTPQLLLPLGRDQAFNAGRVEQLEAGIRLPPDAPPERIRIALRTLLTDQRFPAAATLAARRIAADEPERTAAEAIERTVHC